ncbi:hypothetical protein GmHk_U059910 [Glycine max]|nr:hypothetical protein GmHk_U059910 [Glycine max]
MFLHRTLREDQWLRLQPTGDPTNQLPCAYVYSPVDSHTCQTPWSVFQDGRQWEPTADARARRCRGTPRARAAIHNRDDDARSISTAGLGHHRNPASRQCPEVDATGSHCSTSDRHTLPYPLPRQFLSTLDSLFKVLFIFPHGDLFAIGLSPVFSLGRNLPPDWGCILNNPDIAVSAVVRQWSGTTAHLSLRPFQGTWARSATEDAQTTPDAEGDRFSWWAFPARLATKGILVSFFSSAIDMLKLSG